MHPVSTTVSSDEHEARHQPGLMIHWYYSKTLRPSKSRLKSSVISDMIFVSKQVDWIGIGALGEQPKSTSRQPQQ